jgi:hypothetical protein
MGRPVAGSFQDGRLLKMPIIQINERATLLRPRSDSGGPLQMRSNETNTLVSDGAQQRVLTANTVVSFGTEAVVVPVAKSLGSRSMSPGDSSSPHIVPSLAEVREWTSTLRGDTAGGPGDHAIVRTSYAVPRLTVKSSSDVVTPVKTVRSSASISPPRVLIVKPVPDPTARRVPFEVPTGHDHDLSRAASVGAPLVSPQSEVSVWTSSLRSTELGSRMNFSLRHKPTDDQTVFSDSSSTLHASNIRVSNVANIREAHALPSLTDVRSWITTLRDASPDTDHPSDHLSDQVFDRSAPWMIQRVSSARSSVGSDANVSSLAGTRSPVLTVRDILTRSGLMHAQSAPAAVTATERSSQEALPLSQHSQSVHDRINERHSDAPARPTGIVTSAISVLAIHAIRVPTYTITTVPEYVCRSHPRAWNSFVCLECCRAFPCGMMLTRRPASTTVCNQPGDAVWFVGLLV